MTLELDHVGIGEEPGAALPVVSAVAAPGRPGVIAVETEQAPVLASLVAGGRMQPDTGRVLLDGHEDPAAVRATFALVDTPGVAEPFPVMSVKQIVREELSYAGQRPSRSHVDTVLDELGIQHYADTHVQRVPTEVRVRLLVELALLREGVTGLVLTSPERHGGAVEGWFAVVRDVARRGVTVVLVTSKAAAATVESLLDTVATHEIVEPLDTTQTEGPEDATRNDGTEPRLQADAGTVTEAPATVPTEATP
ncbi:hypothetical protein SAMN02800687_1181 [Curtobacterium sp. UNCCL20]|uniref:hypothetical protein n=1 Tax=Curtobacterium sp. UNCCL20 TaxID=1502773 RepID=UPI0008844549|nr:hypothetical protein [Curtobacterium sp. UNCCL20]SDQ27721.1 hypothetical protein SAMN02800687_1181 [Curtobacterium sp. UNCCL20]